MPLELRPSPVTLMRASEGRILGLRPSSSSGLVRVRHGVYAQASAWQRLPPWDRYLARVHAYALVAPDAIFMLESAAALWGLPVFGEPRDIHIWSRERGRSVRYGDVAVHTTADARRVAGGLIRTTSLLENVVDLGRVLPPARALAVLDTALSTRSPARCSLPELIEIADRQVARRGTAQLELLWTLADGASESVGETISRAVAVWSGFATPELQHEFHFEGVTDRTDFFWPDDGIAGESDGYGKYDASDVAATKAHFIAEKKREDRLRRHVRGFARWDLADAQRVGPLRDKLRLAGVPMVRPAQFALLGTLTDERRSAHRPTPAAAARETHRSRSHTA